MLGIRSATLMLLYKYRPWNQYTAEVVTARKIFLPTRLRLNDPAELLHPVRFEVSTWASAFDRARSTISKETFALSDEIHQRLDYLEALIADGHKEVASDSEFGHYLKIPDRFWRVLEAVFDKSEVHDAIAYYALVLAEDRINMYDTEESIVQRLNTKLQELGVLSLSARCDCPVMWAHYSQNHRGVVLILDSERDKVIGRARPIEYVSERPTTTVDTVIKNLYRKAAAWAYEEEYRVLSKRGDVTQVLASEALAGIILGARMSECDQHAVLGMASRLEGLPVYQAYADPQSFSIFHKRLVP
jgi:hypothetical protein